MRAFVTLFIPGKNSDNARVPLCIINCYKERPKEPPYYFECMITLVKASEFPIEKFETALLVFSGHLCRIQK